MRVTARSAWIWSTKGLGQGDACKKKTFPWCGNGDWQEGADADEWETQNRMVMLAMGEIGIGSIGARVQ